MVILLSTTGEAGSQKAPPNLHEGVMKGCLGHGMFLFLHLVALLVFFPALILTVPLHLIYGAVSR